MLQRHREEHEAGDAASAHASEAAEVKKLREQAQKCRSLAGATVDIKAKGELLEMAREYEVRALWLCDAEHGKKPL